MSRPRKMPDGVTDEVFVQTWQAHKALRFVIEVLGMTAVDASAHASYLRRNGVPLQRFTTANERKARFAALADLARASEIKP